MTEDWIAQAIGILGSPTHENRVSYLYLDLYGHPTIGAGHLVARRENALKSGVLEGAIRLIHDYGIYWLPIREPGRVVLSTAGPRTNGLENSCAPAQFVCMAPDEPPFSAEDARPGPWGAVQCMNSVPVLDLDEMLVEARILMQEPFGQAYGAGYFQRFTNFRMTDGGMDQMLRDDIEDLVKEIKSRYLADFDKLPLEAKLALLDLRFRGDLHYGDKFAKAVKDRDWKKAVELCPLPDEVSKERNADRLQWLKKLESANGSKQM